MPKEYEIATLAMGCFWKPDYVFSKIKGVLKTEVGYTDGDEKKYPEPTYQEVCSNKSGFAEAVQITFDPKKIKYEEILKIFWNNHNPTTMNRQGPDVGSQYRSAIFYHTQSQKKLAESSKKEEQKKYREKIVTEIKPAKTFFKAEAYHQKYLERTGGVCY